MTVIQTHRDSNQLVPGILTEDLQGALAVACRLRQRGLHPTIVWDRSTPIGAADAVVVDLDLHHAVVDPALHVREWVEWLREKNCGRLEVRLNAELRGEPGVLVDGILDVEDTTLLVVPAYPTAGRVCVEGRLLSPMSLEAGLDVDVQTALSITDVELVSLSCLNQGAEKATKWIQEKHRTGKRRFIFDGTVEAHLEVAAEVASALQASGYASVTASTGGWLRFFPDLGSDGFVVVVTPATHQTDREQLRRLAEGSSTKVLTTTAAEVAKWTMQDTHEVVAAHRILVIHDTDKEDPDRWGIAKELAAAVRSVLDASNKGGNACLGIVTSGGLTMSAVVKELDAEDLDAGLELEPLCPTAQIIGGPFHELRLLSKASGTGTENTLLRMTRQILGT